MQTGKSATRRRRPRQVVRVNKLRRRRMKRKNVLSLKRNKRINSFIKQQIYDRVRAHDVLPQEILQQLKIVQHKDVEAFKYILEKKCQICSRADRQASIILCDRCDDAYHAHCLNPPLSVVPETNWFCKLCEQELLFEVHQVVELDQQCYLCRQQIEDEKFTAFRNYSQYPTTFTVPLAGINCRHCKRVFHQSCLNERISAVNCSQCQNKLRQQAPKSYEEYLQYIRNSQQYDSQFFKQYQLCPLAPPSQANRFTEPRWKYMQLKVPNKIVCTNNVIKACISLYYALATVGARYIDTQIYSLNDARAVDNDPEKLAANGLRQLHPKDQAVYQQFKRLSNRGIFAAMQIVQSKSRGFHVRALEFIAIGTIICQYVGEVLTARASLQRKHDDSIFSLIRTPHSRTSLDICPQKFGNISRFFSGINNKRRLAKLVVENIQTMRFKYRGKGRVLFFAKKNIQPGDDLYIDYNAGAFVQYPTDTFI